MNDHKETMDGVLANMETLRSFLAAEQESPTASRDTAINQYVKAEWPLGELMTLGASENIKEAFRLILSSRRAYFNRGIKIAINFLDSAITALKGKSGQRVACVKYVVPGTGTIHYIQAKPNIGEPAFVFTGEPYTFTSARGDSVTAWLPTSNVEPYPIESYG